MGENKEVVRGQNALDGGLVANPDFLIGLVFTHHEGSLPQPLWPRLGEGFVRILTAKRIGTAKDS